MPNLFEPVLERIFKEDKRYLEETDIPIITVSGTYHEDLKKWHGLPNNETDSDIVFSRAHYSMALGIATQVWGKTQNRKKAWIADPTNYVSKENWSSLELTETIGKAIARHDILKTIKGIVDKFGRKKLPILNSITPPLMYLTQNINKPILSLHIAAGNILIQQGKTVLQVITDPHVREEYLDYVESGLITYCVFDEKTKQDVLEKATILKKRIKPEQVIVTGPPVDPRIVKARSKKIPWRSGPLNLCVTTGGLGTNKGEILSLLHNSLTDLKAHSSTHLMLYASTHEDIFQACKDLCTEHSLDYRVISDQSDPITKNQRISILYHPQLVDANELLIKHAFPWAHGFVTKPSGDMAYDAVAAGCFLLTLNEWGEWEHNIREIFEQKGISRVLHHEAFTQQLDALKNASGKHQSWIERAMHAAHTIDPLFLKGCEEIVKTYKTLL